MEAGMINRGLGESRQRILEHLKRRGSSTIPTISADLDLNVETVRTHLKALGSDGLTQRVGSRRSGPGRPEILYGLTDAAEAWFPNRESDVLRELTTYLQGAGDTGLVHEFFADYVGRRRSAALARVEGLGGAARLEEVASILTEDGFMAEVQNEERGRRVLRLSHCPLGQLVDVTKAPCRAELSYVRELLGERLARVSYIPTGDSACCYAIGEGA
jgi:predicted ArsR family transcriptional regulator